MAAAEKNQIQLDGQSLITKTSFARASEGTEDDALTEGEIREGVARLALVLDLATQRFGRAAPTNQTLEKLIKDLHELRQSISPTLWQKLIPMAQQHAVMSFLMQDPMTNWSFTKPRGYSGDAGLLDIYYKHPSMTHLLEESTPLGREIYEYTSNVPACAAGRERCHILAQTVDDVAEAKGGDAEILSVAAGHLREAEICRSLSAGLLKRWVALDQDPVSVGTMMRDLPNSVVEPTNGSILGLMRRSYKLESFDLVYASGLYDYLQLKVAAKLLQRLMEMVRPGGTLLFANFSDEILSDGYMETFMDWPLILRSGADMQAIIDAAFDRSEVVSRVWYGSNRNIVYATLQPR